MSTATRATDEDVLDALLQAAGGHARTAGGGDEVAGVAARWVAEPGATDEVAAVLAAAAELGLTVVARGSGSRLRWGPAPRSVDVIVDLHRMDQVLEHEAGDLVTHVQAGARLDHVQQVLAAAGQHLALDPFPAAGAGHRGTVGGVIATAAGGPLRHSAGGVRDLLIGTVLVRADGVLAHSGGKVVKNVAGYDLGKVLAGSWGTLAIVTEATFRLHPLAPVSSWVSATAADHATAAGLVSALVHSQLTPAAVELDRPPSGDVTVTAHLAGTADGVRTRVDQLTADVWTGGASADGEPPSWWGTGVWQPGDVGLRLTHRLTGLPVLLDTLDAACASCGVMRAAVRGSAGFGVLHAALPGDADPAAIAAVVERLRAASAGWQGDVVVLDAPAAVRDMVDMWGPARGLPLMRRVKDQFDPGHRLAPGRFVGGI